MNSWVRDPSSLLILKSLWLLLPAAFANMSPLLAKNLFPHWDTPVDFGKSWSGKEIFGAHKTYRGFASAAITGGLVFIVQQRLDALLSVVKSWSLFDYQSANFFFGAYLGLGALLGDLIKSFFKRRINIPPGDSWIIFDQIDWIFGALIAASFIIKIETEVAIVSLVLYFFLDVFVNVVAYKLNLREKLI